MASPHADDSSRQAEWRETFEDICDRHRGRLIRWVTAIFGPRDAEDIAQETLARLYMRPGLLDENADAWPWLAVVARHLGRDLARHNSWSTAVDAVAMSDVADDVVVLDQVVARDEGARLALALRSLTPRERAVIRLRDIDGAPVSEIAELLGVNENAVRQQLFRARRRLAAVYVDLGGDSRLGSLVAAVGMRLREVARRYSPFVNDVAPPSTVAFASLGPAVAAVVGGVLAGLLPGAGGDAAGAGGPAVVAVGNPGAAWDARDEGVRHGTGDAGGPLPTSTVVTKDDPPPLPRHPVVQIEQDLPGGKATFTQDDPWTTEEGDYDHHYTYVDIPGTPYRLEVGGHSHQYPGGPTACRLKVVRCT